MQKGLPREILNMIPMTIMKEFKETGIAKMLLEEQIYELRFRIGKPICIRCENGMVHSKMNIAREQLYELFQNISRYSIYAYEEDICNGYITMKGGHRVGVAGKVIMKNGMIQGYKQIYSLNVRIATEVKGCCECVLPFLYTDYYVGKIKKTIIYNTLIVSPPGCGKTTLLRDIIRAFSNMGHICVGVVDERGELAAGNQGIIANDLGDNADVMEGCSKAEGVEILIRTMNPDVIVMDEIGKYEDFGAMCRGQASGCSSIATVHGKSLKDLKMKEMYKPLFLEVNVERFVLLDGKHMICMNEKEEIIWEGNR